MREALAMNRQEHRAQGALLQDVYRCGDRCAEPFVPLVAAARAAHGVFAANGRAVFVDGAAGGVWIHRDTPAIFTPRQYGQAVVVVGNQP